MSIDTSKTDRDRLDKHMREANAAAIEIAQLQSNWANPSQKKIREAQRHMDEHLRGMVGEIVRPKDGVLKQLDRK
jgi:hypothetical protein